MSKVLESFARLLSGQNAKKTKLLVAAGAAAILLLLLSELLPGRTAPVTDDRDDTFAADYTRDLEKRLASLLSQVDGAGKVTVMVTLEDCYENEYATESSSGNGGHEESYPTLKNGSGKEESLLLRVRRPKVRGAAVVARGADDPRVAAALTEAAAAVLGVSSARISVEKMTDEKETSS